MRTCLLTCKNFFLLIQLLCFANHVNAQEITWNVSTYNGYNVSCHGASDGWINIVVVNGTPPYLYNWSNGSFSKNQTNLEAGIYTVIVTDANQNTISAEIELQQPNALEVSLIPEIREGGYNISENGGNDGVIGTEVQGGVLPYTYLWSNNTTSNKISNGVAGTYSLVLTDMSGCTAGGSATLTQPTELQIVSISSPLQNGYNIACFDAKNGSIDLTVTGGVPPYEYQWSNGAFTEDIGELEPGSYWVIVRDANGVGDAAQIVLTGPSALEASFSISSYPNGKNVSCYACSNGSVSTTVNGGAAPFTFQWEHGATSANLTNLGVGSYNLILTDANGCRLEARAEILGPDRDDWTMSGNAGTDPSNQFIGTTDNKDIVFKTNSTERMRLKASGSVNFPGLAGTGSRTLQVSQNGDMEVGPIILNDVFTGICGNLPITNPFLRTNIDGPWNAKDVINCSQRFGFGVLAPQERIDVKGFGRFTSNTANSSYLNIGNDGDSKINSFGTGELLINSESTQNVKICADVNGGDVITGGNTFLSTLRGRTQLFGSGDQNPMSFQFLSNNQIPFRRGITIDDDPSGKFNFYIHEWQNASSFNFLINDETNGVIKNIMNINENGSVSIGPNNYVSNDYLLGVQGTILATEVVVMLEPWPDFVFNKDYKLLTLDELRVFIDKHSHLPDIPPATEIKASGLSMGEIISKQMLKIEELTLYILELKDQLDQLNSRN